MYHSTGIIGSTKIGLVRNDTSVDPMYLDIQTLKNNCSYKGMEIHCYDKINHKFVTSSIIEIVDIGPRCVRNYKFTHNCHDGKLSFGTENFIIATPDQKILSDICEGHPLEYIEGVNEKKHIVNRFISIKRKPYNEDVDKCISSFLISFDYYISNIYNIVVDGYYYFVANGFLVKGIDENETN